MNTELEDRILDNTSEWIHKTALWYLIKPKVDKKRCFDTIDELVNEGFLQHKIEGNRHYFRRKNEILTDKEFEESEMRHKGWMVDTVKAINRLKKPLFKYIKIRKQFEPRTKVIKHDLEVLDYYINSSTIHQARIRLAKSYNITNKRIADKRINMIEKSINDTVNYFLNTNKGEVDQIKEYSQRITRRMPFRI